MKRAVHTVLATVVAMAGLAAIGGGAPAGAAVAALNGFEDIVVDTTHGRVFISTGTEVVVTDLAGQKTDTVRSLVDTAGLALAPDQSTLYVARPTQHAITAIDTVTLAVTHHATPDRCPTSLAPLSGGVVWFTSICDPDPEYNDGPVVALETLTGEVTGGAGEWSYADPWIESTPGSGDVVSVIARGSSTGRVWIYDASVDELGTPRLSQRAFRQTEAIRASALRADGTGIVVSESGDFPKSYLLSGLTPTGDPYRMSGRSLGARYLAFSDDGWFAADDRVFAPGEYEPFKLLDFGYLRKELGIAWGDGKLYAVTAAYDERDNRYEEFRLKVITVRAESRLSVTVPDQSVVIGDKVPVKIKLETSASTRRVKLYAIRPGGERTLVASPVVDADGVTVATRPRHNTTYRAVYPGDESVDPANDEVTVKVKAKVAVSASSPRHADGQVAYFRSGDTVTFVGRAQAFRPSCLNFNLEIRRDVQWLSTDIGGCVTVEDGRARFRLGSQTGEEYHRMRMRVWLQPTDFNTGSNAAFQQIQFCRRSVPCAAP